MNGSMRRLFVYHNGPSLCINAEPTVEELEDEALASNRLWELDTNRLTPEVGIIPTLLNIRL